MRNEILRYFVSVFLIIVIIIDASRVRKLLVIGIRTEAEDSLNAASLFIVAESMLG